MTPNVGRTGSLGDDRLGILSIEVCDPYTSRGVESRRGTGSWRGVVTAAGGLLKICSTVATITRSEEYLKLKSPKMLH